MNKEYKSTIEAFISAKREIKALYKNAEAYKFKFADLVIVQEEVNRVLENKGLDLIELQHIEHNSFTRMYYNNKGDEKTKFVSIGTCKYIIGSIYDNERLEWILPADFANDNSEHDTVYSANSISYRYFLLRAFAIPTLDENEARQKDKKEKESNIIIKEPLRDEKGNIIWEPSTKQMQLFNSIISKNELLKEQIKLDSLDNNCSNSKEYVIFKGKKWLQEWLGNNYNKVN